MNDPLRRKIRQRAAAIVAKTEQLIADIESCIRRRAKSLILSRGTV